jgi:hypothetical protein
MSTNEYTKDVDELMVTDKYVESDEDCDLPKDKDDCEDDSIKC